MQKNTKKSIDFFTLYRSNQLRKYFLSGGIAVFSAFSFVSMYHGDVDMQGLMASVSSVTETPRSDADIIMTRQDQNISITFGAKAENVDQINFSILSDPTRLHGLTSSQSTIHITSNAEMGAYHVSIDMNGGDLVPGTRIADIIAHIDPGTPIAIIDTEFMSKGQSYSLTNKVE